MRKSKVKDLSAVTKKTTRFADAVHKEVKNAHLKDHGGNATITMMWGMNAESVRDQVFIMEINGEKAYIDLEELLSYTRLI